MKKFLSMILCTVIAAGTFCACESEKNIPQEEFEYGATMRQLADTEIDICYDGRFFTDDEMRAVSSYYYAIQEKNNELFMSTQQEDYVAYVEKQSGSSVDDFINGMYNDYAASLGENYEFTYIEAVSCGDRTDDLEIEEITKLMDGIYEESGKEGSFEDSITSAKYGVFNFTAENNNSQYNYNGQVVYIFTCTDGIYIYTV